MTDVFKDRVEVEGDGEEEGVKIADHIDPETGRIRLLREQCTTCIYLPGNLMHLAPGGLAAITAEARDTLITCHTTLPSVAPTGVLPAVCRGWYDGHGKRSRAIRIMTEILGEPVEVDPPSKEGGTGADEA